MHTSRASLAGLFLILTLIMSGCGAGQPPVPTDTPVPPTALPSATPAPSATPSPLPPTPTEPPTPVPQVSKTIRLIYVDGSKAQPDLEVWLGYYDEERGQWVPQQGLTGEQGEVSFEIPQGSEGESATFVFANSKEKLEKTVQNVSESKVTGFRIPPDPNQKSLTLKVYGKTDISIEEGSMQMWTPDKVSGEMAQGTPEAPDANQPLLETSLETDAVRDAFDDNANQWPVGDVHVVYWRGSRTIHNGLLEWQGVSVQNMYSAVYPDAPAWGKSVVDGKVSARVKIVNLPMEGSAGLALRSTEDGGYYTFMISPEGYYTFLLYHNDEWITILDWTALPNMNWEDWNEIAVEAAGSHFTLYLNGKKLAEADDDTLAAGEAGVRIEMYQSSVDFKIQFDDFAVEDAKK